MNEPRPTSRGLPVDRVADGEASSSVRARRHHKAHAPHAAVATACAACIALAALAYASRHAHASPQAHASPHAHAVPHAHASSPAQANPHAHASPAAAKPPQPAQAAPIPATDALAGSLDALQPIVRQLVEHHQSPNAPHTGVDDEDARPDDGARADAARGTLRVDVEVGRLDERLRLAPCARIEPQWPAGQRAWGRIRVGLRCVEGPVRWKVYLPVTVKVFGRALVAREALPVATRLDAGQLVTREVDLTQGVALPLAPDAVVAGRELSRALAAGEALRASDLRTRQWFAAGDVVQVVALGDGYQVGGEGTALDAGLEGRRARVRTESGRIVVGQPVAERRIEVRP